MALPGVQIQVKNGQLGQLVQTDDALAGMLIQGVAASGLALGVPKLLTSLQDAVDVGIDAAYDTANSVAAYKEIKEFYDEALTGARLWIMLISQAITMGSLVDKAEANNAVALLDAADGKIRLFGVVRNHAGGYAEDTAANQVDAEVITAITNAQAMAEEYATNFKPFRVLLPATYYTENAGTLVDLKQRGDNRVAVVLGDTVAGNKAAIGLALGRLARYPVHFNMGRVLSGALVANAIYLGDNTLKSQEGDVATIHDKGFVTFRRHIGKAGYFFTNDPTATAATDDYDSIARGRVIDKAIVIAYTTFVEQILASVEIDDAGRLAPDVAKYYQIIIENAVNQAMTANEEISDFTAQVDPDQNVLSTGEICVEGRIVPLGYAEAIIFKLGFDNPANA